MLFFFSLTWFLLCIAVGVGASKRNRFGFGWFLFAFFLSPLVAGIFLLAVGPKQPIVVAPKSKHSDWSKIAWTPEQQLVQAEKTKINANGWKQQDTIMAGITIVVTVLVMCLIAYNS